MFLVRFVRFVVIGVVLAGLSATAVIGQSEFPSELVNIWKIETAQDTQIITLFSDGSYTFFYSHNSTEDSSDVSCTRIISAHYGMASLTRQSEIVLDQAAAYYLTYPTCLIPASGDVEVLPAEEMTYPVSYDSDPALNGIMFDGVPHSARFSSERSLYGVDFPQNTDLPTDLVARWSNTAGDETLAAVEDLIVSDDGSFVREGIFGNSAGTCSMVWEHTGELAVDGMTLVLDKQDGTDSDCSARSRPTEPEAELYVWWMVYEEAQGYSLYLNGIAYTYDPTASNESERPNNTTGASDIHQDNFDDNPVDWETAQDANSEVTLRDGVYVLEFSAKSTSYGWLSAPGFNEWSLAPQFDAPFVYEADILAECSDVCSVGLLFGVQQTYTDGMEMAYYLVPDADNVWAFSDVGALDEEDVTLDTGIVSESLDVFDGEFHRFRIEVENTRITFTIDGQFIAETTGEWDSAGTIGIEIRRDPGTRLYVEVDNVEVRPGN